MKVEWNGVEYVVKFEHYEEFDGDPAETRCVFYTPGNREMPVIDQWVTKHASDRDDKAVARKFAFGRALRELFPTNRPARQHFWNEFLKNHKVSDSRGRHFKVDPKNLSGPDYEQVIDDAIAIVGLDTTYKPWWKFNR